MEESHQTNAQNSKPSLLSQNQLIHTIYSLSSRSTPIPNQQKIQDQQPDIPTSFNQSLHRDAKQRIQKEYDRLASYIGTLQDKFLQINQNQLDSLSDKHKYFLRKFKKCLHEHKKFSDLYDNLNNIVLENQSIQQQINSINFIKMISVETDLKLQKLKKVVLIAEKAKTEYTKQIQNLKMQLKNIKTQYFNNKREQQKIQNLISEKQKIAKKLQIQDTMRKIRFQKRLRQISFRQSSNEKDSNYLHYFQKSLNYKKSTHSNDVNHNSTLNQLKNINYINKNYIKKLNQTCQNFKFHKLQNKKKLNNKLVSQTDLEDIHLKSKHQNRFRKTSENELLKNQQIIKQLQLTTKLREEFHQKTPQQLLYILVQNKKLKDLLGIIEDYKAGQTKKKIVQKIKLNLKRSQSYKNSIPFILKPQDSQKVALFK